MDSDDRFFVAKQAAPMLVSSGLGPKQCETSARCPYLHYNGPKFLEDLSVFDRDLVYVLLDSGPGIDRSRGLPKWLQFFGQMPLL